MFCLFVSFFVSFFVVSLHFGGYFSVQFPFYLLYKIDLNHFRYSTLDKKDVWFINSIDISNLKQYFFSPCFVCFFSFFFCVLRHRYESSSFDVYFYWMVYTVFNTFITKNNIEPMNFSLIKVFVFTLRLFGYCLLLFLFLVSNEYCVCVCLCVVYEHINICFGFFLVDSRNVSFVFNTTRNEWNSVLNCPNNYRTHINSHTFHAYIQHSHSHHIDNKIHKCE